MTVLPIDPNREHHRRRVRQTTAQREGRDLPGVLYACTIVVLLGGTLGAAIAFGLWAFGAVMGLLR